jgi:superkiller protein 3
MGVTLQEQGKLDAAIVAYQRALEIKPVYAEAYYNMGNALQEQGKFDAAIAAYQRALEITPAYAEAYNNMVKALQEQHRQSLQQWLKRKQQRQKHLPH